jgi:hypothetical protein
MEKIILIQKVVFNSPKPLWLFGPNAQGARKLPAMWMLSAGARAPGPAPTRSSAYAAAGTGSAVTDLIFSIAKRDVTFFSGTAPISFL